MNRLHNALSPYLLQHADNPVHWQPWDDAALAQAAREDKPILLSVGYAACHWCHVMAHESFADAQTAAVMNAHFVNVKVDREERPDIDRIYQAAHYLFSRKSGGWPLTMFLTPAGEPFFGGTYFPPTARFGLPSFGEVLARVHEAWTQRRALVNEQNADVVEFLRGLDVFAAHDDTLSDAPLRAAAAAFLQQFDDENGGLGDAPKFPHPVELGFCLHYASEYDDKELLEKTRTALLKIAGGGLYDHIGGGFFRYCVDSGWHVPHFEKMLYDNGLLLGLFAEAAVVFDEAVFRETAAATAGWVLDTMGDAQGAFYASLDADSEGGEGAFYLWGEDELKLALSPDEYTVFSSHYALAAAVRVEGKIHLTRRQTPAQTAAATALSEPDCRRHLAAAAARLLQLRGQRPPPATDDKILTAWNALMCRGLARSGRLLANEPWLAAARRCFDTLWQTLRIDGRTRTARRGGQISAHGFLDDCAFLLAAAVELLRVECSPDMLAAASALADELCAYYEDSENGGFFFCANDGETLIRRLKSNDDNATPSGNGVALNALLMMEQLTAAPRLQKTIQAGISLFYRNMHEHPTVNASLLAALHHYLTPPPFVYLTGERAECRRWQRALGERVSPSLPVFCLPPDTAALPPSLQKAAPAAGVYAYVCDRQTCSPPAATLADLMALLEK